MSLAAVSVPNAALEQSEDAEGWHEEVEADKCCGSLVRWTIVAGLSFVAVCHVALDDFMYFGKKTVPTGSG